MAARSLGGLARCASALMALAGLQACVDDGVSLHVLCPIFPEIEDNVCIYDPEGEACVLEGIMNFALTDTYKQSFRVESGLLSRQREVPPRGEPNGIQIRSAVVDIRLPTGERIRFRQPDAPEAPRVENPRTVYSSGFIAPGAIGVVSLPLITPAHATQLRTIPQIAISVQVRGTTSGNQEVTAGEYIWPVRLVDQVGINGVCADVDYCPNSKGQDAFAFVCE